MKRNFENLNFPALHRLSCKKSIQISDGDCERLPIEWSLSQAPDFWHINQKKQKTGFDQSFLNDSSYLYSYPIKIPKPENHTSERNQYSLNKLVQIYKNSDGKYVDANKKIIKNEDVYIVTSPDNGNLRSSVGPRPDQQVSCEQALPISSGVFRKLPQPSVSPASSCRDGDIQALHEAAETDSMTVYFFKLEEIIHYRKNHEKSSDGISCRFSLKFTENNEEQINPINLIDVLDKNCFYKTAYDRHVPYTSLYKILCIKTGKEYLMTSSLSGKKNDTMLSVGLPYDHPFCIGIDKDVVLHGKSILQIPDSNKNGKRKHLEFNPFPETILPPVFSESIFIDGVFR